MRVAIHIACAFVIVLAGCNVPVIEMGDSEGTSLRFRDVSDQTGIRYSAVDRGIGDGNASASVTDFDNDGWPDLLLIGGKDPALLRNDHGTFTESGALPPIRGPVHAALFVDVDADGWDDLLLLRKGLSPVFLKNTRGTFRKEDVGLNRSLPFPLGATAADFNRDGCVDLFVIQSGDWARKTPAGYNTVGEVGRDNGNANYLYRGDCSGFEPVVESGIKGKRWSLATSFADLTDDGWPDIHVANDYNNDVVYINNRAGGFRRVELGDSTDRNGMSSELADIDRDGHLDVFVTNIYIPIEQHDLPPEEYEMAKEFLDHRLGKRAAGNTLLTRNETGAFVDKAPDYGIKEGGWGWAATFADFDADGDLDLFHTTQTFLRLDKEDPYWTYPMLWEQRDGTFRSVETSSRGFEETDGRGTVALDFDRDGDLDVLVAQHAGPFRLYENRHTGHDSVEIRLVPGTRESVLGTEVTVVTREANQTRTLTSESDFLSQEPRELHFGLGRGNLIEAVYVTWPGGETQTVDGISSNGLYEISRTGGARRILPLANRTEHSSG